MAEITTFDADWLLEQWVRWNRIGSAGGQPVLAYLTGTSGPMPVITDEEALAIDYVVGQLLRRMPEVGEAVVHFYCAGRNYSAVSKIMSDVNGKSMDRKRVMRMVSQGVAWVDGKLDDCRGLDRVKTVFSCLRRGGPAPDVDDLTEELVRYWQDVA